MNHAQRASVLLFVLGLTAVVTALCFGFMRAMVLQRSSGNAVGMHQLAMQAAEMGSQQALEMLLRDQAAEPFTRFDSLGRAWFRAHHMPFTWLRDYANPADTRVADLHDSSGENLLHEPMWWDTYNANIYVGAGYHFGLDGGSITLAGPHDGRGRWIEPGLDGSGVQTVTVGGATWQLPCRPVRFGDGDGVDADDGVNDEPDAGGWNDGNFSRVGVSTVRAYPAAQNATVDVQAHLLDPASGSRCAPLLLDKDFHRLPATTRSDYLEARKVARYRLRYACEVRDLDSLLLWAPVPDLAENAIVSPDPRTYADPALAMVARSMHAVPNVILPLMRTSLSGRNGATWPRLQNLFAGRGAAENYARRSDADPWPRTFPLMYRRTAQNGYSTYLNGMLWDWSNRQWPFESVARDPWRPNAAAVANPAGGDLLANNSMAYRRYLPGPPASFFNLTRAINALDDGYGPGSDKGDVDLDSGTGAWQRAIWLTTPFGHAQDGSGSGRYGGPVATPWHVNLLTAHPWVVRSLVLGSLPPGSVQWRYNARSTPRPKGPPLERGLRTYWAPMRGLADLWNETHSPAFARYQAPRRLAGANLSADIYPDYRLWGEFPPDTEDKNFNGVLDRSEDRNNNGVLDPGEDRDGDGELGFKEDRNGNGVIDVTITDPAYRFPQQRYPGVLLYGGVPPVNGPYPVQDKPWITTKAPFYYDAVGDIVGQYLDVGDDFDVSQWGRGLSVDPHCGQGFVDNLGSPGMVQNLSADHPSPPPNRYLVSSGGEDVNGNGVLDVSEDVNGNGVLDPSEDLNGNGKLDPGEDANGNGKLDLAEDKNGNGVLDTLDEDINGNGVLDGANPGSWTRANDNYTTAEARPRDASIYKDILAAFNQAMAVARHGHARFMGACYQPASNDVFQTSAVCRPTSLREFDRLFIMCLGHDPDDPASPPPTAIDKQAWRGNMNDWNRRPPSHYIANNNLYTLARSPTLLYPQQDTAPPPPAAATVKYHRVRIHAELAGVCDQRVFTDQDVSPAQLTQAAELVINDFRFSLFGSSPDYYADFRPLDFNGDGSVAFSGYAAGDHVHVAPAAPGIPPQDVFPGATWPAAIAQPAKPVNEDAWRHILGIDQDEAVVAGQPLWPKGAGPWTGTVTVTPFCMAGNFFIGRSRFWQVIVRGELYDNLLKQQASQTSLETVFVLDQALESDRQGMSPNPGEAPRQYSSRVLFQRWHYNLYQGLQTRNY